MPTYKLSIQPHCTLDAHATEILRQTWVGRANQPIERYLRPLISTPIFYDSPRSTAYLVKKGDTKVWSVVADRTIWRLYHYFRPNQIIGGEKIRQLIFACCYKLEEHLRYGPFLLLSHGLTHS